MDPLKPYGLTEAIQISESTAAAKNETLGLTPIRLLEQDLENNAFFKLVPYTGQDYYAISYTWPSADWDNRLGNSKAPIEITHDGSTALTKRPRRYTSHHFSQFAVEAVKTFDTKNAALWMDIECIDQDNPEEKDRQVLVMDSIYGKSLATVVLLEDTWVTDDEHEFLTKAAMLARVRNEPGNRQRYVQIVRRILTARWFGRAWCTQEMVLSKKTCIVVHRSPDTASSNSTDAEARFFPIGMLTGWMTLARMIDPRVEKLSEPRGLNNFNKAPDGLGMNSVAWAFGVVSRMGCWDPFDKVRLVLNLVCVPVSERLRGIPEAGGVEAGTAEELVAANNMVKILNTYAFLNGDYSLLLTGHLRCHINREPGFGWAAFPQKGDITSESWSRSHYSLALDPAPALSAAGITLRGLASRVESIETWRLHRPSPDTLRINIDGTETHLSGDDCNWLTTTFPTVAPVLDICYALLYFSAAGRRLYPFFTPPQPWDDWVDHVPLPDGTNLRETVATDWGRTSTRHDALATAVTSSFIHETGKTEFHVLTLEAGDTAVVVGSGNVCKEMLEKATIFQPFVVRPKVLSTGHMTVNSMVLEKVEEEDSGKWRCRGGVRGFGLLQTGTGAEEVRIDII